MLVSALLVNWLAWEVSYVFITLAKTLGRIKLYVFKLLTGTTYLCFGLLNPIIISS